MAITSFPIPTVTINPLDIITPEAHGAVGDGVADDTLALLAAEAERQATNKPLVGYGKAYRITDTITFRSDSGRGTPTDMSLNELAHIEFGANTVIVADMTNKRAIIFHGRGITCPYLFVKYATPALVSHVNSYAVAFRDVSLGMFGKIRTMFSAIGVAQDVTWGQDNYFFDNMIDSINVYGFSIYGVNICPSNEGNTPSRIGAIIVRSPSMSGDTSIAFIRTGSGEDYIQPDTSFAVRLKGTKGLVVDLIVIETFAANSYALDIDDCPGFIIGVLHFESVLMNAQYATYIKSGGGFGRIGGISMYDTDTGGIKSKTVCGIFDFWGAGAIDVGTIHFSGIHSAGADAFLVSASSGNRMTIERFVDSVGMGTTFVNNGVPVEARYSYTEADYPIITSFNGLPVDLSLVGGP